MAELTIEQQVSGYDWLKSLYLPEYDELSALRATATTNRVPLRMGRGAGPAGLALRVIPFENRVDWRPGEMTPSTLVWMIKDVFTTHNGSWEVSDSRFSIDAWARLAYLRSPTDPLYYNEGGGDHHMHVMAMDKFGTPYGGAGFVFTSDGAIHLQPPTDPSRVHLRTGGATHGWANLPMFRPGSTCSPPGILGPWSLSKLGMAADILVGVGLPDNWHVATFVVYETLTYAEYLSVTPPPPPPPPGPDPGPGPTPARSKLALAAAIASTMTSGTRGDTTIVNRTLAVLNGLEEGLDDE